jgi:lycopene beta-cyclase
MTAGLVLVGGGLANCLIALRLRTVRPDVDVQLLERDEHIGGRHTWSFHEGDLTPGQLAWVRPLVAHSWPHHEVRFPAYTRQLGQAYHSITTESLRNVILPTLRDGLRSGVEVVSVTPQEVVLGDGTVIHAHGVVDGRGVVEGHEHLDVGFQKFLGLTLALDSRHGLEGPVLMDATVSQDDGFRFLYTLPFGDREVLVEDTRYSDTPSIRRDDLRAQTKAYAERQGWTVRETVSEEEGSLPIVLGGNIEAFWDAAMPGVARAGMRAALFHPTTGYSLPDAVRLADTIAMSNDLGSKTLYTVTRSASQAAWHRGAFFRMLNRMLYRAAAPEQRYRVLEHFYRLGEPLVERFYAGRLTWGDRLRVLMGRPPVPVWRAARAVFGATASAGQRGESR